MPVSQKPRKPRGTPQYQRDLQAQGRGLPAPPPRRLAAAAESGERAGSAARRFVRKPATKAGLAVATLGGAGYGAVRVVGGRKKETTAKNLRAAVTPERVQTVARMVDAAVGAAAKPAPKASRARSAARAAANASVPKSTKRKATLKLVGGGVAATAGAGTLFGAGSGLGHRATDRRVTAAKAHYTRTVDGTNVRRVTTPKGPSGKYVSHENDLKVYTPKFKSTRRAPRGSRLQHWTKGGDAASKPWVSKLDGGRDALNPNRRGQRIA